MNNKEIEDVLGNLKDFLFYNEIGLYQKEVYEMLLYNLKNHKRELFTKNG